jgi:hypothetical protein
MQPESAARKVSSAIACIASAVYVALVVFDGSTAHHTQWYPHEGLSGFLMCGMRILLLAVTIPAAITTVSSANPKMKTFLKRFLFWSACYVLALPVCMLIAGLFAPYYRKFVMELFEIAIQGVSVTVVAKQAIGRGEYYRMSSLGQTFLPSAKGD